MKVLKAQLMRACLCHITIIVILVTRVAVGGDAKWMQIMVMERFSAMVTVESFGHGRGRGHSARF